MQHTWLVVVLVAVVLVLAISGKSRRNSGSHRYVQRGLMTRREFEFFGRLRASLPEVLIHPQVAMSAIVDVKGGSRAARNRFDRKVFDFVVCDRLGKVLYVIELDDRSHASGEARRRDAVKDQIAQAAGLRLIRYQNLTTAGDHLRRDFEAVIAANLACSKT